MIEIVSDVSLRESIKGEGCYNNNNTTLENFSVFLSSEPKIVIYLCSYLFKEKKIKQSFLKKKKTFITHLIRKKKSSETLCHHIKCTSDNCLQYIFQLNENDVQKNTVYMIEYHKDHIYASYLV